MESLCKNSYLLAVDYLHKKVLSEMFYRVLNTEAVVSRCSSKYMFLKISKIDRKTPLLESLFEKLQAFRSATLLKRDSNIGVYLRILRNF